MGKKERSEYDKHLVRRALKRDVHAQNELYHKYKPVLHNFIFNIVKNEEDASDLVMITFARAFKYLDTYNFSNAFSTWLFRIAVNKSIDFLRQKQKLPITIDTETYGNIEDIIFQVNTEDLNPEELLIQSQSSETLNKLIAKLNPYSRKILELRYFKHLAYEDIATELNVSVGTVKAQLHRAKHLLRNIIQTHEKHNLKFEVD